MRTYPFVESAAARGDAAALTRELRVLKRMSEDMTSCASLLDPNGHKQEITSKIDRVKDALERLTNPTKLTH